jgi:hypothetical protein
MDGTKYNYTCKANLVGCEESSVIEWTVESGVDPNPSLIDCKAIITLPWKVTETGMEFCNLVQLVKNSDSMDSIGIKSIDQDCAVMIQDSSNTISAQWLSTGSFKWFRNIQNIGCVLSGDGLYNNCSGTAPLVQAIPKIQGNSEATEIIVTEDIVSSGDSNNLNIDVSGIGEGLGALASGIGNGLGSVIDSVNPVDDFMENIKVVIIVVVCVISGVVVIIIIIAVICCLANKKEIAKVGGTVFETMVPGGAAVGREMRHLYDDDGRNSVKTRSENSYENYNSSKV